MNPSLIILFFESYSLFSVLGKSIFYLHECTITHTQTRAHQWNRSTIRRRRECRRRRLRRGSGRREAGQGGDHRASYHGQGHRRAPSPLLPHLRLVCDEMAGRNPIMTSYMYVLFFMAGRNPIMTRSDNDRVYVRTIFSSLQIPSDITCAPKPIAWSWRTWRHSSQCVSLTKSESPPFSPCFTPLRRSSYLSFSVPTPQPLTLSLSLSLSTPHPPPSALPLLNLLRLLLIIFLICWIRLWCSWNFISICQDCNW